ncbi:MAG: TIGR00303 family protein [Sulfolobales archaeon]
MSSRSRVRVAWNEDSWRDFHSDVKSYMAVYFIASTRVSTIPGISLAGASPEQTLYTPALDVEYLMLGAPKTMPVIPTTPEGIPTPALLTRVALSISGIPYIVVDSGSFIEPMIPHIDLRGRSVGGRIDIENALPLEKVLELFEESRVLGRSLGSREALIILGESMPGGTTTAMAIIESLGFRGVGRVSSASPSNPHDLKKEIFEKAVRRSSEKIPVSDVFKAVSIFGDPLHISMAGFTLGALERDSRILLSGGTQMAAVLAILRRLEADLRGRVAVGTTRWIIKDESSDIIGLVRDIYPEVPIAYASIDFSDSPYPGLRAYERGFVKEGVGAGGSLIACMLLKKIRYETLLKALYSEYERIVRLER